MENNAAVGSGDIQDQDSPQLSRAKVQRFAALENAFATIQVFAEPSLNPDEFEKYEEVKGVLIERYKME